ncbi:MOSC domain-containing protein [Texcoconibacillus texcoconensis]|uniref:MOSC domain-containing protein YiiM n=1 Tax=Texcoconibacillus texcoconensis TaxID=1095777 RepID=A0A840QUC5_9BACI|nr:MOSC domain-containing protein [Texcoconibacillus texcoconensis]MBB5175132.1 MOSC domain-containing protein YiiM [Texcoconibacillus texcoconensis]
MNTPFVEHLLTGKARKVGDPNATDRMDREWESGIFKDIVQGEKWLGETGLLGDEVADKKNHGGPEKAILAYPTSHYDYWKSELALGDIGIGAMGENLAVSHMDEHAVCLGDTYQFGDAIIQVAQPRQPCWKPARRFRRMDFALRIQESGRTGWYFRILKEGYVQAEQDLTLIERPYPHWTVAKCNEVMHKKKDDLQLTEELASCQLLADSWRQTLNKRLKGEYKPIENRVFGPNKG